MFLARKHKVFGFTLAELLSALAILGIIATFTIPKVLIGSQNNTFKAVAKEDIAAISEAYQAYRLNNTADASTNLFHLTPYLNYVRLDTASVLDDSPGDGIASCTPSSECYRLANNSVIMIYPTSFAGTTDTNCLWFGIDPDGKGTGNEDSMWVALLFNGRISTWAEIPSTGCTDSSGLWTPKLTSTPSWFSW